MIVALFNSINSSGILVKEIPLTTIITIVKRKTMPRILNHQSYESYDENMLNRHSS